MIDVKKTPKANLEDKRFTYILMGLVLSLGVFYVAFEWTDKEITVYEQATDEEVFFEEEMIEQTVQEEQTAPPPPPPATIGITPAFEIASIAGYSLISTGFGDGTTRR